MVWAALRINDSSAAMPAKANGSDSACIASEQRRPSSLRFVIH